MDGLTYRFATPDDLPLIIETRKKVMIADGWKSEDFDDSVKAEEKNIPLLMNEEWLILCFAFHGGELVGMGGFYDSSAVDYGMLARGYFYTEPKFRGRGIMHKLAELLILEAKKRGCKSVEFFIEDKYREPLYALGARDVYENDSDHEIPEVSTRMEIDLNTRNVSYQNLQPLRIPGGWTVILNKFEDIDPETLPADDENWLFAFNEDILYMNYKLVRERNKQTEEQELAIDLGWYPDGDPDGEFVLQAVLNRDWYDPMLQFSSRNKDEIVNTLEKWLWVDFMPVRFIDEDYFRKNHKLKYKP